MYLHARDRIGSRIEVLSASECLRSEDVVLQTAGSPLNRLLDDEAQQRPGPFRPPKGFARQDPLQLSLDGSRKGFWSHDATDSIQQGPWRKPLNPKRKQALHRPCNRFVLPLSPPIPHSVSATAAHVVTVRRNGRESMRTRKARLRALLAVVLMSSSTFLASQNKPTRPPVIDMHTHIDVKTGPATMDRLNVRFWFLAVHPAALRDWAKRGAMANRYLPGLNFPCPGGRELYFGRFTCFETGTEFPDIAWLRGEVQAGRIKAFGEMPPQFLGLAPNDSRLEPDLGTRRGIRHPGRHSPGPRTARGSVRQESHAEVTS